MSPHAIESQVATAVQQPPLPWFLAPNLKAADFARMTQGQMIAWMEVQPPQAETGYKDPAAHRLQELGLDGKADRRSRCGSFALLRCPKGHRFRSSKYRCDLRLACPNCGEILARECYFKWEAAMSEEEREHPSAQITLLEVSQAMPRDRDAALAWYRRAHDIPFSSERPMWCSLLGYHHERLVMRALVITEQHPLAYWQAIWPEAQIKVSVYPIYKLREVFRDRLITPLAIHSPRDRADQEALFTGVRMFRAFGIRRIVRAGEPSLSVIEGNPLLTDNDHGIAHRHDHMTCPECGQKAVAESQWFPAGKIPRPDEIRWRKIT